MSSWTLRRIRRADGLPSTDPEDYQVVQAGDALGRIYRSSSGPRVMWL
jgi:hypothetical protein